MIVSVRRPGRLCAVAASLLLCGCSGTIYKKSTLADLSTLSIDARQRLSFVGEYQGSDPEISRRILCTEPSPDAIVARAAVLSAAGNAPLPSGTGASAGTIAASFGAGSTEAAGSIGLRTQSIQLLRDGYFFACQGVMNGYIDSDDYKIILANLDATMVALTAVDALGGTAQAPSVVIAAGGRHHRGHRRRGTKRQRESRRPEGGEG